MTVAIDAGKKREEVWRYSRPAPDRLVIDGVHLGKSLQVALHAAPPSRLMTRGFHWIHEVPFNRDGGTRDGTPATGRCRRDRCRDRALPRVD